MAENPTPERLTPARAAARLAISRRHLDNLVLKGMPKHGDGRTAHFFWQECFNWFVEYQIKEHAPDPAEGHDSTLTEAQTRKTLADAARAEIKLARERRWAIDVRDVERALAQHNGNVRARLLQIPTKTAGRFPSEHRKRIRALLDAEIREVLTELSTTAGVIDVAPQDVKD